MNSTCLVRRRRSYNLVFWQLHLCMSTHSRCLAKLEISFLERTWPSANQICPCCRGNCIPNMSNLIKPSQLFHSKSSFSCLLLYHSWDYVTIMGWMVYLWGPSYVSLWSRHIAMEKKYKHGEGPFHRY